MRVAAALTFGMLLSAAAAPVAGAEVQLSLQNGHVSIVATDATVRQILTEWARVGQIKIVNVERIPGGPMTLQLTDVAEKQALEILLRSVSGYMAAARTVAVANLSQFDRIVVMPTLPAPRAANAPVPVFQQPQAAPPPDDVVENERGGANMPGLPPGTGPVFNPFPQPQIINPQQGSANGPGAVPQALPPSGGPGEPSVVPGTAPASPFGGTPRPGMIAPTPPPQPGQPGAPVPRPRGPEGA